VDCDAAGQTEAVLPAESVNERLANEANEPRLRVMHVITGLDVGGAEMMLWKLLSVSSKRCASMVVSLGPEGAVAQKIRELGITVHCLGLRPPGFGLFRLFRILSFVRQFRPRIVQGWLIHGNLAASLAGLGYGKQVSLFWNIRQSLYDMSAEPFGTAAAIRAGALISSLPEKVIYASRTSAQQHERLGYAHRKSVIVPNGFDCEKFRPNVESRRRVLSELGIRRDAVLVGLVARYHPMKDHANFLRAAGIVARRYAAAHFVFAGKGVTNGRGELAKLIDEQGLRQHVSLLGERSDVAELTAALDIACSASWTEGFSNSIGEAMACGVPCVVTDVGESASLVGDTGLIVPPRNPEATAHAIGRLIDAGSAEQKKLGIAARKKIESEFSLPRIAGRYEELYKECLAFP